jgi:hypothetical protein
MIGDITLLREGQFGAIGSRTFAVAASATTIKAGEPVSKALSASVVTPAATNTPVVGTDYMAGIAASTSTNTASAAGTVEVIPMATNVTYLISPKVAATFDTQAEYDALVGDRVLIDLTSGTYTILAADNASNGCVIEPLDISKYPGKVAFSIRGAVTYNA